MKKDSKIYVAGHKGLVGSALVRALETQGYTNLLLRTHEELDLLRQSDVEAFFAEEKPEYVFLSAAKVGGILANNTYPADFIYRNLVIETNIIESARINGVTKLLFLGSSCIYPKFADQPMKEEYLLTGLIEPTNEPYGLAKIAGIKLCQSYNRQYGTNFIALMPTNLYGQNDNFDLQSSHVLPALMRKMHEAKVSSAKDVTVWGTGTPKRELLHVDDLASACLFAMDNFNPTKEENEKGPMFVNVGTGVDVSIKELVMMIKEIVGFEGEIVWDTTKPDGAPRKLLDVSRLSSLGWNAKIQLRDGVESTYKWFLENYITNK